MPNLRELGDSNAVDNKYVDRIVFYVEGEDDKSLLTVYLLKHYVSKVEVKTPSALGSGYLGVIQRVSQERGMNGKIFGIVDGEALLPLGHVSIYKEMFGGWNWITLPKFDGIYFIPCWEIENLLYIRDILPQTLIALQPVSKLSRLTERSVENIILTEAFRLSELSSLNLALLAESYDTIRAETKSNIEKRHDLLTEIGTTIASLDKAHLVKNGYDNWRQFFRELLRGSRTRDKIYDEFISRVDGKALSIRLSKKLNVQPDIRSTLAYNFSNNKKTMKIIDALLETVNRRVP